MTGCHRSNVVHTHGFGISLSSGVQLAARGSAPGRPSCARRTTHPWRCRRHGDTPASWLSTATTSPRVSPLATSLGELECVCGLCVSLWLCLVMKINNSFIVMQCMHWLNQTCSTVCYLCRMQMFWASDKRQIVGLCQTSTAQANLHIKMPFKP